MLIKLLPEQVSKNWDIVAPVIAAGLHPTTAASRIGMSHILRSILMERLICWVYETDGQFRACVTTYSRNDDITLERSMLIYSIASIRPLNRDMFRNMWGTLVEHAKADKCVKVVGFVADQRLVKFYQHEFNAKADFNLVEVMI